MQSIAPGRHVYPQQDLLIYGEPAAQALKDVVARDGLDRIFLMTNGFVQKGAFYKGIVEALGLSFVGDYAEIHAHSPRGAVIEAAALARAAGATAIVAVGGGSVIDAAKATLACLWHNITSQEQLDGLADGTYVRKAGQLPTPRLVSIPTTLSGAEFTWVAGITDTDRGVKDIFEDKYFTSRVVILDAAAIADTPPRLLLASGIRAVDHCAETLCSSRPTPFGDAISRQGLRLLGESLKTLAIDSANDAALLSSMVGSWLAITGPASGVPVGASHAIGRVLGGAFNVPHGETSCVLLAPTLEWSVSHDNGRQGEVAALLGKPQVSASVAVRELVEQLSLPTRLSDVGVDASKFDEIADKSMVMMQYSHAAGNQRPVTSRQDVLDILARCA